MSSEENSDIEESEKELVVAGNGFEEVEPPATKKPRTLFLRTDVTLEVEARQIHVNRQTLADHSPVFKGMFESDFKEKHMDNIPFPGKKFEDFEIFLSSFYYNEFQHTITGNHFFCSKTVRYFSQRLGYPLPNDEAIPYM